MDVKHIGIITGGLRKQVVVNKDHAKDIASALENDYEIGFYNLASTRDINRLIENSRLKKLDIVFNNAAGKRGGDGTVEGFLDLLGVPYVGSDSLATAVAFDKKTTKAVVKDAGVPIVRGFSIPLHEFEDDEAAVVEKIEKKIGYPLIVKASQGSDSIGVSLVKKPEDLHQALLDAFAEDDYVVIEDFIKRSAEITCMVIGNGRETVALTPVERVYDTEILYPWDVSARTYRIPDTTDEIMESIKRYSLMAHKAVGCEDYSRSDFLVGRSGGIYFLELNGHAGLGKVGPTAFTAKVSREWGYEDMIKSILQIAVKRVEQLHNVE